MHPSSPFHPPGMTRPIILSPRVYTKFFFGQYPFRGPLCSETNALSPSNRGVELRSGGESVPRKSPHKAGFPRTQSSRLPAPASGASARTRVAISHAEDARVVPVDEAPDSEAGMFVFGPVPSIGSHSRKKRTTCAQSAESCRPAGSAASAGPSRRAGLAANHPGPVKLRTCN